MSDRIEVQWCTTCGARFTAEEIADASGCPKCDTKGVPCGADRDLVVEINWHELRVLGIWASNWAHRADVDKSGEDALRGILSRLERAFPHLPPLTLGGEVRQIRQSVVLAEVSTNIPGEGVVVVHGPGAVGHGRRREVTP